MIFTDSNIIKLRMKILNSPKYMKCCVNKSQALTSEIVGVIWYIEN